MTTPAEPLPTTTPSKPPDPWAEFRKKRGLIVVMSVHHTGTNLVHDHVLRQFRPLPAAKSRWTKRLPPHGKTRIHLEGRFMDELRYFINFPVVVPMRHPRLVYESWKVRRKSFDALEMQYQLLKEFCAPHDPSYVVIDRPDRDKWLELLSKRTGRHIHSRWPVVHSCGKRTTLTAADLKRVDAVMADGFFDPFYGSQ